MARLKATIAMHPNRDSRTFPGMCVCLAVGRWQTIPQVWQELADLGLVKITRWDDGVFVRPTDVTIGGIVTS